MTKLIYTRNARATKLNHLSLSISLKYIANIAYKIIYFLSKRFPVLIPLTQHLY